MFTQLSNLSIHKVVLFANFTYLGNCFMLQLNKCCYIRSFKKQLKTFLFKSVFTLKEQFYNI